MCLQPEAVPAAILDELCLSCTRWSMQAVQEPGNDTVRQPRGDINTGNYYLALAALYCTLWSVNHATSQELSPRTSSNVNKTHGAGAAAVPSNM
jgi:hypothetical protein